jgi:hypothetical protein
MLKLIDIKDNHEIWFQCLHSYSVFYKSPMQVISNHSIVEKLASHDACLVGVVCGEKYKELIASRMMIESNELCLDYDNNDHYNLIAVGRNGSIEYRNNDHKICVSNVLDLSQNKIEIEKFSPRDAYYIGFLSGLELYKIKNNLKFKAKGRPNLRLVYSAL